MITLGEGGPVSLLGSAEREVQIANAAAELGESQIGPDQQPTPLAPREIRVVQDV
jgi:hypothetical protein